MEIINKMKKMKKTILLFSLFLALVMTACYDDYTSDFDYTACYFSYQYPVRTVIVDPKADNFEIQVGVTYGGRYAYSGYSETVDFKIADTLITNNSTYTGKGIKVMPPSWYTLSNPSKIDIIDTNAGAVTVTIKKDSLTAYPGATKNTYAIPFLITGASTDSVLANKNYSIVVVKFKNEFDGRYYVKGVDKQLNTDGSVASKLIYSNSALVLNKYVFLNSYSKSGLTVPRIGSNESKTDYVYNMEVRTTDGTGLLIPNAGSKVKELVGAAKYDYAAKSFICNYNYKLDGVEHSVTDTLIYSNTEIVQESWN